jgi:hypothetical protein
MKWSIVLAGAADIARPAEQLSLTQNLALMCTGAIWTRWCFVIRPKNIFLVTQVTRITMWQRSVKNVEGQAEIEGKALEGELKETAKKAEKVVKS